MKQNVLTLRLILMFGPMSISITSTELKFSLYHADFQAFLKFVYIQKHSDFTESLQGYKLQHRNYGRVISENRRQTVGFLKFTRRNSNKAHTCNISKHSNIYFSFIQINIQMKNTRPNPRYKQISNLLLVLKNLNVKSYNESNNCYLLVHET